MELIMQKKEISFRDEIDSIIKDFSTDKHRCCESCVRIVKRLRELPLYPLSRTQKLPALPEIKSAINVELMRDGVNKRGIADMVYEYITNNIEFNTDNPQDKSLESLPNTSCVCGHDITACTGQELLCAYCGKHKRYKQRIPLPWMYCPWCGNRLLNHKNCNCEDFMTNKIMRDK